MRVGQFVTSGFVESERAMHAGWALCGHDMAEAEADSPAEAAAIHEQSGHVLDAVMTTGDAVGTSATSGASASASAQDQTLKAPKRGSVLAGISREQRLSVGVLCKRLIDFGRLRWLADCGMESEIVCYASGKTTGENRILLARL